MTPRLNPSTCAWFDADPCKRFVAYCRWDDGTDEEIDIDARDIRHATMIAAWVLRESGMYREGGKIEEIKQKEGLYA